MPPPPRSTGSRALGVSVEQLQLEAQFAVGHWSESEDAKHYASLKVTVSHSGAQTRYIATCRLLERHERDGVVILRTVDELPASEGFDLVKRPAAFREGRSTLDDVIERSLAHRGALSVRDAEARARHGRLLADLIPWSRPPSDPQSGPMP